MNPVPKNRSGRRVVYVAPAIPDNAPADIKEGLVRRRITMTEGVCPCGAVFTVPDLPDGVYQAAVVEHAADCPASDTFLLEALQELTS